MGILKNVSAITPILFEMPPAISLLKPFLGKISQFPSRSNLRQFGYGSQPLLHLFKRTVLSSGYDSELGTANLVTRFDMMLLVLPNEELILIFCIDV